MRCWLRWWPQHVLLGAETSPGQLTRSASQLSNVVVTAAPSRWLPTHGLNKSRVSSSRCCSETPLPPAANVFPFIGDTIEYIKNGPSCGQVHHDKLGPIYRSQHSASHNSLHPACVLLTLPRYLLTCRSWLLGERIIHIGDVDACKLLMTCEHDLVEGKLTSQEIADFQSKVADRSLKQPKSWPSAGLLLTAAYTTRPLHSSSTCCLVPVSTYTNITIECIAGEWPVTIVRYTGLNQSHLVHSHSSSIKLGCLAQAMWNSALHDTFHMQCSACVLCCATRQHASFHMEALSAVCLTVQAG